MTFITAEIGINANGSVELACKLIEAAKWAGADAVKFQKRTISLVYAGQLDEPRASPWGTTLGEQKYGLEFSKDDYDKIDKFSKSIKMPWYGSAWDIPSLEFLRQYDLPYNKIASAMVTNEPFLWAVKKDGRPIILSSGLSEFNQIRHAASVVKPKILMHCVGTYPCKEEDLNLACIPKLIEAYSTWDIDIGYSGHESSVSPSVIAVVLGAVAVERHITVDRSMYGSDQAASLEPIGFKSLVDQIRKIPTVLGDGVKRITDGEKAVAKKLRYWE